MMCRAPFCRSGAKRPRCPGVFIYDSGPESRSARFPEAPIGTRFRVRTREEGSRYKCESRRLPPGGFSALRGVG